MCSLKVVNKNETKRLKLMRFAVAKNVVLCIQVCLVLLLLLGDLSFCVPLALASFFFGSPSLHLTRPFHFFLLTFAIISFSVFGLALYLGLCFRNALLLSLQ